MDQQRRKARGKAAVSKIGGFLSNLFFLLSVLFFANGLIYTHMTGSYCRFLKTIPVFLELWDKLTELLLQPGASLWTDSLKLMLFAYILSAALFAMLTGLIFLIYHPKKKDPPALSNSENTALLAKLALEARDYSYKTRIVTSRVAMVITIVCAFALFFAYALYLQDANKINALLSTFPTSDAATNALLYVLAGYFVIDWITAPLLLITRTFYRFEFPYDLVVQADTTALLAREEFSGLSQDTLAEKAAAIRDEGLTLEKDSGYHPAKARLYQAALLGDVSAMEHYARHCLLLHMDDSARYWLNKCVSSGNASKEAQSMYRRMKLRMRHNVAYLRSQGNLTPKQKRLKALGSLAIKLLTTVLAVVLTVAVGLGTAQYFAPEGTEIPLPGFLSGLFVRKNPGSNMENTEILTEEVPAEKLTMTLTEEGTKWENGCIAYYEDGSPVVYSYSQSQGGDLSVPYRLGEGDKLRFAGIYFGNKWDIRKITQHVSYQNPDLVIAQDYLTGLKPGEYFITLESVNAGGQSLGDQYIPLIITE